MARRGRTQIRPSQLRPPGAAKVPVTLRAIVQRLNRMHREDGDRLCKGRGTQARLQFGDFYIVRGRDVVHSKFKLEELARRWGALQPWERLIEETR